MKKIKLLFLIFSIAILQGICFAENDSVDLPPVNTVIIDTIDNPDSVTNQETATDNLSNNNIVPSPYKKPTGKRTIIKKFLIAMVSVLASSLLIFAGLSVYNKIRDDFQKPNLDDDRENYLDEPENLNDAIRSFVDKTNWD